ncbi:MAG: helix-turn-helix domain-containing protein [Pseudomonadota bacterium]
MRRHRRLSTAFRRQTFEEYLAGAALNALSKEHDICLHPIRVWIEKHDGGEFDEEIEAANTLHEARTQIAAPERMVGRQTLEIEFLKGARASKRSQRNGLTSAIKGPMASRSSEGASRWLSRTAATTQNPS